MLPSLSDHLAAFAAETTFAALPPEVVEQLKRHALDAVGVALAAAGMPFAEAVRSAARELGGPGGCAVIGAPERLRPPWAALVNGTLIHGLDFDDTHTESVVHVAAGILPAALAAAEHWQRSGAEFLAALAAGMEISIRIGMGARGYFHERGFHPTGICNAFGAAAAAAKLAGGGQEEVAAALGIVGSQAAGLLQFLRDGTDAKRAHAGWAAHCGLVAAALAARGWTGPREVLEGRFGLYRSHLGLRAWRSRPVRDGLGERWECLRLALKPYPCCHYNHAFIDAVARLRQIEAFAWTDVESVECLVARQIVPIVCEPAASKWRPQTPYDAKFSLPYAVACMLARGRVDVDDFTADAVSDPEVLDLSQRVAYRIDPEAEFPRRYGGAVRLRLRGGRVLEWREAVNRGSAERPLAPEEVRAKFFRNAARSVLRPVAEAIAAAVEALDRAPRVDELAAAVAGCRERAAAGT